MGLAPADRARLDRALGLAALALAAVAVPGALVVARAGAQPPPPPPVDVRVEGTFGNDALIGDGYASVVVTARNLTRETFRGQVRVSVSEYGRPPDRHVVPLDLPPGETRRALLTLFVGPQGSGIEARYEVDGRTLGLAQQATTYAPAGRSLVLLADPPRLRATLLDLQVAVPDPNAGGYYAQATGSERAAAVPIGVVTLDGATGDPIVPDEALGWSSVAVVVAQIPMLARLSDPELRALVGWAHAGGHLVLIPRTSADLASPIVRELLGDVRTSEERTLFPGELVPAALPALECPAATPERFGCATHVGAGIAYVLAYDASVPPYFDRPEVRDLLRSIAQRAMREPSPARLPLGRGADELSTDWWSGRPSLARLRSALDPNEGYRPALGLVGIVLFLYVLVVGPLNFRFVLKRNQPTLALLSTPVLAFGCALVMLFVGYLGKGVLMRYRRVEIVEAVEGDASATSRTYTGYFLTAPSMVEIAGRGGGRALRLASGGGDDGLVYDHAGERPRMTSMRGGLWETIFVREDRLIELGADGITFGYSGDELVSITNGTRQTIRNAFVLDEARVYAIGEIAPGASRPIPRSAAAMLSGGYGLDDENDPTPRELATQLGLTEDDAPYLRGVLRLIGGASASPSEPLLWARLDPEDAPESSPGFAREEDLRLLLMRPRPRYSLLGRAPAISTDGSIWGRDEAPPLPPLAPATEPFPPPDPANGGAGGAP